MRAPERKPPARPGQAVGRSGIIVRRKGPTRSGCVFKRQNEHMESSDSVDSCSTSSAP